LTVALGVLFAGESMNLRFVTGLVIILFGLRFEQGLVRKQMKATSRGGLS
jgi:drug/metabolite transporter (DMT)-like permease